MNHCYYKCQKCSAPVLSPNRTGMCKDCRLVKCEFKPCDKRVILRGSSGIAYCREHSYKRFRKYEECYMEGV